MRLALAVGVRCGIAQGKEAWVQSLRLGHTYAARMVVIPVGPEKT